MKQNALHCFALTLLLAAFAQAAPEATPRPAALIPAPSQLTMRPGRFLVSDRTVIVASKGAEAEAAMLARSLRALTGHELSIVDRQAAGNALVLQLDGDLAPSLGPEGYRLSVTPERALLKAAAPAGLFYAGITFGQLLPPQPGSAEVPCVEVEDAPRFSWRGLLMDPARHFWEPEFVKRMIDLMALHKLNTLQLHLTDDQGWRIEIRQYPRLTQIGAIRKQSPQKGNRKAGDGEPYGPLYYTQEQLRDLVAYAQARHVTLVPEIEMPGHFLAALAAYPENSCRGGPFEVRTAWGVEPDILCAGNDAAVTFAQNILGEVVELFPSRFIHIGGDEAPRDRWKTCPKCQARMKAEGLKSEAQLQTWLNRRIEAFLASKGRRMIGWDEILEGGLTPGATVMSWRGVQGGIDAAAAGHDVVMSPTSHCYFDYAQGRGPREPESIGGHIPLEMVYLFEPVPQQLAADKAKHILGAQGNLWAEFLWAPEDVEYFAFPRAIALAEVTWSKAASRDFNGFRRRLEEHLRRLDRLQVRYRPLDPQGRP